MDDDSLLVARIQRPRVLDSWSPAPLRVKMEIDQGYSSEYRANGNDGMLLNRWRELGQERSGDSGSSPTALLLSSFGASGSETTHRVSTRTAESDRDHNPKYTLKMSVNQANGHITIVRSPSSTIAHHSSAADPERASGSIFSRANTTNPPGPSPADLPLSPITEDADEEDKEEMPQIFLGVVFGVIPSQWYRKSLAKWHSGVETLGGRFISPSDIATPNVLLLPLSDERSNLVTPIEDTVPEQWRNCPLAITSWITQCVMTGKLLQVPDPDDSIAGLDPLAIRLLEQRKAKPNEPNAMPAVAQSSSCSLDPSKIEQISMTLTEMGETVSTQSTAFRAFVDGQGALQTQVKQMASAVTALAEQLNRSHQTTTQRLEQLSELVQKSNRYLNNRNLHGNPAGSAMYSTTVGRPRAAATPVQIRDSFVTRWSSQRLGAERPQTPRPVSHERNAEPAIASISPLCGMLPTSPDSAPLIKLPDVGQPSDRKPLSLPQECQAPAVSRKQEATSCSRATEGSLTNVEDGQIGVPVNDLQRTECLQYPTTPNPLADNACAAPQGERQTPDSLLTAPGAIPVPQFNPDTMISPTDLQDLLRNVFSGSPMKGQELFWRKSRNIYIEHLGNRAPRRTCIAHISDVSKAFPKRYMYDKIIFVSTSPKEPPLSVLFDMKEKEVVIYDTVDRYRNNLFTFANEKKLAEQFGLKDAPWYVVELVAKIGKDDAFPLVCLATKIFACRDRRSFRDLFPPHIVVAKKNIKNPIPPRRQAKADYCWRHVRPRVVKHLVKEMSAVLITRYRHEQADWLEVPKCTEWMEGIIRFEDSEDAKELLPDGRHKRERSDDSRPASRAGGNSLSPIVATAGQQKRAAEEALAEELAAKKLKVYLNQNQ